MSDEKETKGQVKPTVLGKVEILVYSDGNVSVKGPVDNPVIMMNIFGRAMNAVVNHITARAEEGQIVAPSQPNIIVPN